MIATLRMELFKLSRRMSIWILGAIIVAIVILGYLLLWHFVHNPPRGARVRGAIERRVELKAVYPHAMIPTTLGIAESLGGALCMVVGCLVVGSEYGWGTMKTVLTQLPGRTAMFVARAIAVELFILLFDLAMFGVAAALSASLAHADGQAMDWPSASEILKGIGIGWLVFSMWTSFGMVLAYLFRQSGLAIGIGLVYMLVLENIILGLLTGIGGTTFTNIARALPSTPAGALTETLGHAASFLGGASTSVSLGGGQALAELLGYFFVFTLLGLAMVLRRDVL
jgi:ABC-2 type transport system permease protein